MAGSARGRPNFSVSAVPVFGKPGEELHCFAEVLSTCSDIDWSAVFYGIPDFLTRQSEGGADALHATHDDWGIDYRMDYII